MVIVHYFSSALPDQRFGAGFLRGGSGGKRPAYLLISRASLVGRTFAALRTALIPQTTASC
jgi:hypothetical protein